MNWDTRLRAWRPSRTAIRNPRRIASQGIAESRGVTEMVIGIPYNMNGTEGPQVRNVREFIERLRKRINVPIHEWDERLTTFAAERVLLEADISRGKEKRSWTSSPRF